MLERTCWDYRGAGVAARPTRLIGAAIGLGARDRGCADAPGALQAYGAWDARGRLHSTMLPGGTVRVEADPGGSDVLPAIAGFCRRLAVVVADAVVRGERVCVLGGDHSCALGTWTGVRRVTGPVGLVWIDAHMDSHTPATSPSGAYHGMPLAALLGHGAPALVELGGVKPKLKAQQVCLVGVRSYEPAEAALLQELGVRVFFMKEVRRRGLAAVMQEAIALARQGTTGFGISVDIDALDPRDAPGVGTPEPGGIRGRELVAALRAVALEPAFVGLELAEFNPARDVNNRTAALIQDLLAAMTGA